MTTGSVSALRRRIGATWPLRPLLKRPRVERVVAVVLRAGAVRERLRFIARELPERRVLAAYRLRDAGLVAHVRHGTGDVVTLDEVFLRRDYDPPPPVAARLDALDAPRIVDLGSNVGFFGLAALARWPGAELTAIEPDPANLAVLDRTVGANPGHWTVVRAAAGTAPGRARFLTGRVALSRLAGAGEEGAPGVAEVQVVDAFAYAGGADLVKLDIEGGEWPILADPRLRELRAALVLEYHPNGADAHADVRRLLDAAGYTVHELWRRDDGHGMVWAWRAA